MTQLVGSAKARELYYLSDRVSADEALQLGLANWVVEPEALMGKTMEIAKGWPPANGCLPIHEGESEPRYGRRGR